MSAPLVSPEVARFVEQVRAELDDLGADEIDELTGGLEADLDDALADGDGATPADRLGDPVAYAAELRAAAGLPPRAMVGGARGAALSGLRAEVGRLRGRARARLERQPGWPATRDFLVALRPVWWVARAWIAYQVLHANVRGSFGTVLPNSLGGWVVLALLVVASVQMGRRMLAGRGRWWRRAVVAVNVLAVICLPPALSHAEGQTVFYSGGVMPPSNGLWLNGTEVRNVFPYDAQGRPLQGVQLFDENGRPLDVGDSARTPLMDDAGAEVAQVPAVSTDSQPLWNVYPLRQQVRQLNTVDGSLSAPSGPQPAPLPQPTVQGLLAPSAAELTPAPTATPSAAPTTAPTASPPGR